MSILSVVGWAFLPGLVSSWLQAIYYGVTIRAADPKPARGSPSFIRHQRNARILVVSIYLLYTIYEADWEIRRAGSFYTDLSVGLAATDREVKARFRRLAALHHPDKVGSGADADAASTYFMQLKLASDVLQDATRRFAYDRFGDAALDWKKVTTIREYLYRGVVLNALPYYGVIAASMFAFGSVGYLQYGKAYRWLIFLTVCIFEIHIVTRPAPPPFLDYLNVVLVSFTSHPALLPFQAIALARRLGITSYMALTHLGPLLAGNGPGRQASNASENPEESETRALNEGLARLEQVSQALDSDVNRLLEMEFAPYKGDTAVMSGLQASMKEWLVQNTIRADPMVKDALGTSLRRRRLDAPTGAKGTK